MEEIGQMGLMLAKRMWVHEHLSCPPTGLIDCIFVVVSICNLHRLTLGLSFLSKVSVEI